MSRFTLDPREYRKKMIEGNLQGLQICEELYEGALFRGDQKSLEDHKGQVERTLAVLKKFGIEATTYLEAIDKYAELKRSWETETEAVHSTSDLQAKWGVFCDAQEREEIAAYLNSEGLLGKPESSYSLTQKAAVQRIKNTWQNTKRKSVG